MDLSSGGGTKNRDLLPRVANPVLARGEAFAFPSPCGVNCSYTTEFEGPYFECANHTETYLHETQDWQTQDIFEIYAGYWYEDYLTRPGQRLSNATYSNFNFSSRTLTPLQQNTTDGSLIIRQDDLICLPGRAKFTVNNTYRNNIQNRIVSAELIERLVNLKPPTKDNIVIVSGYQDTLGYGPGKIPANWSSQALAIYRDVNHMTIISSMMSYLTGNISAAPILPMDVSTSDGGNYPTLINSTIQPKYNGSVIYDVVWDRATSKNYTIIDTTRFNINFGHFKASEPANMAFNITQDVLNDHLFNLTVSMMESFGTWSTAANATVYKTINVYNFSQPLSLLIPYFLTLALSIPFLILGGVALFKNGVSAMDSSFMQIIATSTGSATLDRAAAGGCLGGDESVAQELKDLKIRYGEIIGRESSGLVKRAGFGVEDEVTELRKGANYGIARWV